MLLDIASIPTAENSAIHLHPADNIAVARVPISAGATLVVDGVHLVARDAIAAGHKVAVKTIQAGETVVRYGQSIGRARELIEAAPIRMIAMVIRAVVPFADEAGGTAWLRKHLPPPTPPT